MINLIAAAVIHVFFSPNGGAEAAAIAAIDSAQSVIHVNAYSYTSKPIEEALERAVHRSVEVDAILDAGANAHNKRSEAHDLKLSGATVCYDWSHPISHSKIIIIDDTTVVTGSFNFSLQAEHKNAENLLVITDDAPLVKAYLDNWHRHEAHCRK